jgi:hypothetical protein
MEEGSTDRDVLLELVNVLSQYVEGIYLTKNGVPYQVQSKAIITYYRAQELDFKLTMLGLGGGIMGLMALPFSCPIANTFFLAGIVASIYPTGAYNYSNIQLPISHMHLLPVRKEKDFANDLIKILETWGAPMIINQEVKQQLLDYLKYAKDAIEAEHVDLNDFSQRTHDLMKELEHVAISYQSYEILKEQKDIKLGPLTITINEFVKWTGQEKQEEEEEGPEL